MRAIKNYIPKGFHQVSFDPTHVICGYHRIRQMPLLKNVSLNSRGHFSQGSPLGHLPILIAKRNNNKICKSCGRVNRNYSITLKKLHCD